jgi:hypothetical protein
MRTSRLWLKSQFKHVYVNQKHPTRSLPHGNKRRYGHLRLLCTSPPCILDKRLSECGTLTWTLLSTAQIVAPTPTMILYDIIFLHDQDYVVELDQRVPFVDRFLLT